MTDPLDPKLASVVLAEYRYRYEAEFAAGFLDEAGIPYRLQVDDAAMGLTPAPYATLWVRGIDLEDAREVLDLPEHRRPSVPQPPPPKGLLSGVEPPARSATSGPLPPAVLAEYRRHDPMVTRRADLARRRRFSGLERTVSLILSACFAGAGAILAGGAASGLWAAILAGLAVPFGVGALLGRTIEPFHGLVRALSGTAP